MGCPASTAVLIFFNRSSPYCLFQSGGTLKDGPSFRLEPWQRDVLPVDLADKGVALGGLLGDRRGRWD